MLVRIAAREGDAIRIADDMVDIAEGAELIGLVVDGAGAAVDVFDALVAVFVIARDEPRCRTRATRQAEAGLNGAQRAAMDAEGGAVFQARFGGDVDDACRAQAILRGQRAGDEVHLVDQAGAERLAEHRYALGQDHPVQAVLHAVMLVADVELAELVLTDAGHLQDDVVDRLIVAAGQVLNRLIGQRIGRCAKRRLDAFARGVEARGGNDDLWRRGVVGVSRLRGHSGCSQRQQAGR